MSLKIFVCSLKNVAKGDLISESFSLAPKKLPNHYPDHHFFRWILDSAQDSNLAQFFRDWSQSKKLSEIKLHL